MNFFVITIPDEQVRLIPIRIQTAAPMMESKDIFS